MKEKNTSNRVFYIDILRYIACFLVVGMHTSGIDYYTNIVAHVYDIACHYAVPIFVAISGAVNIGKNISFSKLCEKIMKLAISYLIWSIIYFILLHLHHWDNLLDLSIIVIAKEIIRASYHMWFIPMICALYLLLPIIDTLYKDKRIFRYSLFIVLLFSIVYPAINKNININRYIFNVFSESYLAYFVLGAYLKDLTIKKIYVPIAVCLIIITTFILELNASFDINNIFTVLFGGDGHHTVSGILYVSSIFILIKAMFENKKDLVLPELTYGIYMIHPIIIKFLWTGFLNIPTIRWLAIVDIPINIILTFILSGLVIFCISKLKVPFKHYLLFGRTK